MANGKYRYWLSEDGLLLLSAWAADGLSAEEIAGRMGVSPATLKQYKGRYPEIAEALEQDGERLNRAVEKALLDKALGGNVAAISFWLRNRSPRKWRAQNSEKKEGEEDMMSELRRMAEEGRAAADAVSE